MIIKLIGVVFVIVSCGSVGFKIASNYKKEENSLRNLVHILNYMESELQYRLMPLPELCRQVARTFSGIPGNIFTYFADEMEMQKYVEPVQCITTVLNHTKSIPPITRTKLELLGQFIGRFDLDGQIKDLEAVRIECETKLTLLCNNRESRLRSYQTLGLCAGAALAILFV